MVSKNGNLLLNFPLRPGGTLDPEAEKILSELARWMRVNSAAIHGARPWKVFGEGPTPSGSGFKKERTTPFTARDIRFTTKTDRLYAIVLGWPAEDVKIRSLDMTANLLQRTISRVRMLGSEETLQWSHEPDFLAVTLPRERPCDHAVVFEIT